MRLAAVFLVCSALAAQTPEVQFRLATAGGQMQFRLGEAIPLELTFTSTVPDKYAARAGGGDRMGIELTTETFLVSPTEGAADPLADYFKGGMDGSGLFGQKTLGADPFVVRKDLNQWLRFDRPGRYRVRATSHRVHAGQTPVELQSNEIEIELVDDPAWRAQKVEQAANILRTVPKSGDSRVFNQRMSAARQLAYLDTPESIEQSARLMDGGDVQVEQVLRLGLVGARDRQLAIRTMERVLADRSRPVSPIFLDTLGRLRSQSRAQVRESLGATLEAKTGAAKAASFRTFIQTADSPDAFSAAQRIEFAGLLRDLPADQQRELLGGSWNRITTPALLPVLRAIYESSGEPIAVERLYQLDSVQGRQILLADMARPSPRLPFATLSLLPDATLPDLEEQWAASLESQRSTVIEELIARYATDRILPRVKTFYARLDAEMRSRKETVGEPPRSIASTACEPPLYAYFLRTDPAYGEKVLRDLMAARNFPFGRCWATVIGRTARYYTNAEWESVALDGLNDPTVIVKIDAVKALGAYGSPAAAAHLWESFRYFHDWWKDKPDAINDENRQLEQAYMQTLSEAANWISTGDDFTRASGLCITAWCRGTMEQNRRYWDHPQVTVAQASDGSFFVSVAQYSTRSLEEARKRLLQLPKGTEIAWKQTTWENRPAPALEEWTAQVQRELRDRGITIR